MWGCGCRPKKHIDGTSEGVTPEQARKEVLAAIDLVVQKLPGYTLGSVFNEIDYETLSEITEAKASGKSNDSQSVITPEGTRITPGRMGVDPGNQPVMSLAEFAKKF